MHDASFKFHVIQSYDKPNSETFDVIKGDVSPAGYPIGRFETVAEGLSHDDAVNISLKLNSEHKPS